MGLLIKTKRFQILRRIKRSSHSQMIHHQILDPVSLQLSNQILIFSSIINQKLHLGVEWNLQQHMSIKCSNRCTLHFSIKELLTLQIIPRTLVECPLHLVCHQTTIHPNILLLIWWCRIVIPHMAIHPTIINNIRDVHRDLIIPVFFSPISIRILNKVL